MSVVDEAREALEDLIGGKDVTAGDLADWLDSCDGRVADIFELWVTGKRSSRWAAEQLIDEGHLARLAALEREP